MVNDHYPVFKWLAIIGKINPTFSDTPIYSQQLFLLRPSARLGAPPRPGQCCPRCPRRAGGLARWPPRPNRRPVERTGKPHGTTGGSTAERGSKYHGLCGDTMGISWYNGDISWDFMVIFHGDFMVISWCFSMALGVMKIWGYPRIHPWGLNHQELGFNDENWEWKPQCVNFNKCGTPKMKPWVSMI